MCTQTITRLRRAGIKVWVLTGDKMETAVNIGKSCALIDDTLELHVLRGDSPAKVKRCLEDIIEKLDALDMRLSAQSGVDVDGESAGLVNGGSRGSNTGGPNGNAVLISPKSRQKSEDIELRSSSDASLSSASSSAAAAAVSATAFVGASIVADGPALQFALAKV